MAEREGPAFYVHRGMNVLLRVHDLFTVESWTPKHMVWRRTDAGHAMDDLYSPSWQRIAAEEAQEHITRLGGGINDALAPPTGDDGTYAAEART